MTPTSSRVAVTGASGFLGSHICRALITAGHEPVAVVRRGSDFELPPDLDGHVESRAADVTEIDTLGAAFRGVDAVVHSAAAVDIDHDARETAERVNLNGTRNVVDAVESISATRFVHISSVHAFGPMRGINLNATSPLGVESRVPYTASKGKAHEFVSETFTHGRVTGCIVCPSGLVGPGDLRPSLVGQVLIDIASRRLPFAINEGFWWADIRDVAAAVVAAVEDDGNGDVYFTAGHHATHPELAEICSEWLGSRIPTFVVPYAAAIAGLPLVSAFASLRGISPLFNRESLDMARDCPATVDQSAAASRLGYQPRPLRESIFDALDSFRSQRMLD